MYQATDRNQTFLPVHFINDLFFPYLLKMSILFKTWVSMIIPLFLVHLPEMPFPSHQIIIEGRINETYSIIFI